MSREEDFKAIMVADATLMAILTGGVYTVDEVSREGITRETNPGAFGTDGFLLPCALVSVRSARPNQAIRDEASTLTSADIVVEIYNYEDQGYENIDAAQARQFTLFQGSMINGSYPVSWINTTPRARDTGPLGGASVQRQDWLTPILRGV